MKKTKLPLLNWITDLYNAMISKMHWFILYITRTENWMKWRQECYTACIKNNAWPIGMQKCLCDKLQTKLCIISMRRRKHSYITHAFISRPCVLKGVNVHFMSRTFSSSRGFFRSNFFDWATRNDYNIQHLHRHANCLIEIFNYSLQFHLVNV